LHRSTGVWIAAALLAAAPPAIAAADVGETTGEALFQERCAGCHDQPKSRAPIRAYLATRLPSEIVYTLTKGEMKTQAAGLSADQVNSLAKFLTGREIDAEADPRANLCTDDGSGIVAGDDQWSSWGRDVHNTRFQPKPGFTAADLPRLKVKWAFALPGLTGAPVAAGDHLFVSSRMGKVFALNTRTGCTYWSFEAGGPVRNAIAVGALGDGRFGAYFGDQTATVHALDARTGAVLWEKKIDDYATARIVGSITFAKGVIYVPVTSGDEVDADDPSYECCRFRGSVTALDAATGTVIWKGYTITEEPAPTHKNDAGTQMYGPAGAGVWSAPTVDEKRGIVFAATGDSYTNVPTDASDAVVAFDLKTGKRLWASQVLKDDAWIYQCNGKPIGNCPSPQGPDYDFSSPPLLQTMANGKDILVSGSKSAKVHAFDPDAKGKHLWSVTLGQGSSGNPIWGLAADRAHVYAGTPSAGLKPGTQGGFSAIDLATGKVAWRIEAPTPVCSWGAAGCLHTQTAAAAVIPGVAFSGAMDGHLRGYDTGSGKILWDFDCVQTFDAVNGVKAFGGNLDSSPEVIADGTLFLNAGNSALSSPRHGDAVLAITVDGK
jgi:polyvinyl alcohol dehydrogenase (cytochrome)